MNFMKIVNKYLYALQTFCKRVIHFTCLQTFYLDREYLCLSSTRESFLGDFECDLKINNYELTSSTICVVGNSSLSG